MNGNDADSKYAFVWNLGEFLRSVLQFTMQRGAAERAQKHVNSSTSLGLFSSVHLSRRKRRHLDCSEAQSSQTGFQHYSPELKDLKNVSFFILIVCFSRFLTMISRRLFQQFAGAKKTACAWTHRVNEHLYSARSPECSNHLERSNGLHNQFLVTEVMRN